MAIRRALNAFLDGWLLEDRLRRAARMVAADARRHGLPAEQMLVALKREWPSFISARAVPQHEVARGFAERLVTRCIHEFYATPG